MAYEYLKNVSYVAHVHFFIHLGRRVPMEIGISSIDRRETLLLPIRHYGRFMTDNDQISNHFSSSTLPVTFRSGEFAQHEAQKQAVAFVGDKLVAVVGEEAMQYFTSIGMQNIFDIKKELDVPPLEELLPTELPFVHEIHRDPAQCSRILAIAFAKHLEDMRLNDWGYWDYMNSEALPAGSRRESPAVHEWGPKAESVHEWGPKAESIHEATKDESPAKAIVCIKITDRGLEIEKDRVLYVIEL